MKTRKFMKRQDDSRPAWKCSIPLTHLLLGIISFKKVVTIAIVSYCSLHSIVPSVERRNTCYNIRSHKSNQSQFYVAKASDTGPYWREQYYSQKKKISGETNVDFSPQISVVDSSKLSRDWMSHDKSTLQFINRIQDQLFL